MVLPRGECQDHAPKNPKFTDQLFRWLKNISTRFFAVGEDLLHFDEFVDTLTLL